MNVFKKVRNDHDINIATVHDTLSKIDTAEDDFYLYYFPTNDAPKCCNSFEHKANHWHS